MKENSNQLQGEDINLSNTANSYQIFLLLLAHVHYSSLHMYEPPVTSCLISHYSVQTRLSGHGLHVISGTGWVLSGDSVFLPQSQSRQVCLLVILNCGQVGQCVSEGWSISMSARPGCTTSLAQCQLGLSPTQGVSNSKSPLEVVLKINTVLWWSFGFM